MKRELEWKNMRGLDVLCMEDGQVIATVRKTHEDLWKASYGDDPQQIYASRDQARRAMLRRDEEAQKALFEMAKRAEKAEKKPEPQKEGKKNAGKDS